MLNTTKSDPLSSMERVAADLCQINDHNYLVLVDYYSNFIEVDKLSETTSETVINCCKCHFARHGIPDVFVSDNGPQFSSTKFHQFSKTYRFNHHTSSPHYPQSNGKAEKAVQTINSLLQKSISEKKDFQLALLDFRNTPTNDIIGSPAQRLMGRRTKTLLPTTATLLAPKTIQPSIVKTNLLTHKDTQKLQKLYYDRDTKVLPTLNIGNKALFQCGKIWKPAIVKNISSHPRSYIIITTDGQTHRRNRRHIRPSHVVSEATDADTSDIEDDETPNIQPVPDEPSDTLEEQNPRRHSSRRIRKPVRYDPSNPETV